MFGRLMILLMSAAGSLQAQSYPQWGPWWQQPIAREYGGEARDPNQPLSADEQLQQDADDGVLVDPEYDITQQRGIDETIQQNRVDDRLQQRIYDELMQQGNTEEILQQRNIDDLLQQRRYDELIQQRS